jgi:hypothetical protein
MTFVPLLITTLCYFWTALGFYHENQPAMCAIFVCYAMANCGFLAIAAGYR